MSKECTELQRLISVNTNIAVVKAFDKFSFGSMMKAHRNSSY